MDLLLTSGGITDDSLRDALVGMLGRPITESTALCIPTASYGHPMTGPENAWHFLSGTEAQSPMVQLGWKSIGVLELTALPTLDRERWVPWVHDADVLLVDGGDALYLAHWMRESGLADLLPDLDDTLWVSLSGGSMVMTPRIGREFVGWIPPGHPGGRDTVDDSALGVVGFSIFPHLDHPDIPTNTMPAAERWASRLDGPAYAIDDATAIRVVDGEVDVVSEGRWRYFPTPEAESTTGSTA